MPFFETNDHTASTIAIGGRVRPSSSSTAQCSAARLWEYQMLPLCDQGLPLHRL